MEKKNQNTNKKIIQTSNKQVHQMRDTRTKNASQKRSKKHRKKQVFGRQSIFAGGFCIVAALAIVIGIFVSNKTKTPYEKQVITLYEKENESLAEQQTNPEAGMDEGISSGLKQVRDYGVKLPESFQITLQLSPEENEKFIRRVKPDLPADQIAALYLNIRYENHAAACVTGTSLKIFMLDKQIEQEWDETVRRYFRKLQIPCVEV